MRIQPLLLPAVPVVPAVPIMITRLVFAAALGTWPVYADWTQIPAKDFSIGKPPATGSKAEENDFTALHAWQKKRTSKQCEEAQAQAIPTLENLFVDTGALTLSEGKRVEDLLTRVMNLGDRIAGHFKKKYRRARPYQTDTSLVPCAPAPLAPKAYPSSHAVMGTVGACVLAKIFPAKEKALMATGTHTGTLRVIAGVHHPSDVAAGQRLGRALCSRLEEEADFVEELNKL